MNFVNLFRFWNWFRKAHGIGLNIAIDARTQWDFDYLLLYVFPLYYPYRDVFLNHLFKAIQSLAHHF